MKSSRRVTRSLPVVVLALTVVACSNGDDTTTTTMAAGTTVPATTATPDATTTTASVTTSETTTTVSVPEPTVGPPVGIPDDVDTGNVPEELLALVGAPEPTLQLQLADEPTADEVTEYLAGWHEWWRWALANPGLVEITKGVDENSPLQQSFDEAGVALVLQPNFDFADVEVIPRGDATSISGTVHPDTSGFALEEGGDTFNEVFGADEPILLTAEISPAGNGEWKMTIFELGQL